MRNKYFISLFIIFFLICVNHSFALEKKQNTSSEQNIITNKLNPNEADVHREKSDEHLGAEHENLELFHAEYYGMPWRSKQTQKDLWYIIVFLVALNLFLLLLFKKRIKGKCKIE